MTIEQNKNIVRRQFELMSAGDVTGATALWASLSLNHGRRVDTNMMLEVFESVRSVQERHVLHEIIGEGDWVAVRTTCSGNHAMEPAVPINSGIFVGLRPTGQNYTVQHIHLFKITNGKISEHWANRDDLGNAKQIGLELRPAQQEEARTTKE